MSCRERIEKKWDKNHKININVMCVIQDITNNHNDFTTFPNIAHSLILGNMAIKKTLITN